MPGPEVMSRRWCIVIDEDCVALAKRKRDGKRESGGRETPAQDAARHKKAYAARQKRSERMLTALGLTKRRAENELKRINPRRCELIRMLLSPRGLTLEERVEYDAVDARVTELVRAICGGLV